MLSLFLRGTLLVLLVSVNTYQIAHQHYAGAGLVGFLISIVGWYNARSAGRSDLRGAGLIYAVGAATGTMLGMWLMHLLYE